MVSKKQREFEEIERLKEVFRKMSDEQLRFWINQRFPASKGASTNKKAFKAVLKERGIEK